MELSRVKKFLKRGLVGAGVITLLGGGFIFWLDGHCDRREKELDEAWGRVQVPLDKLPEKFPAVEDNASALELEERAALLGICLAPARPGLDNCSRHAPSAAALAEFSAIKHGEGDAPGTGEWLGAQSEKPGPEVDPPPEKFRRYLKAHAADLAALREQVRVSPPPRWGHDLIQGADMQLPSVSGLIALDKLLALDALDRLAARDEAAAEADLEAAWKIDSGLESSPTLISQLILIASRLINLSALRKLRAPSADWDARLAGYHPREKIALTIETEIWLQQRTIAAGSGAQLKGFLNEYGESDARRIGWLRFLPVPLLRRVARVSLLDVSDHELRRLDELQRLDPCESPAALLEERKDLQLAWWDFFGRNLMFGGPHESSWNRANRATMLLEAARKLLALKTARKNSKTGRWPASVEGLQNSVCSDGKWSYFAYDDGTMSLTFNKPFRNQALQFDKGIKGANFPLAYREEPAAVSAKKQP
jgi:hypothetical protein